MIIDESALAVLRSKYALPPCPAMARGRMCDCDPKTFTLKACVWQGYKESREMFPPMADTLEKLWAVARLADRIMKLLQAEGPSIVPHLMDSDENSGQHLRDALAALDPTRNGDS